MFDPGFTYAPNNKYWGDVIPGTDDPVDIPGCLFAPGPSAENLNGANQTEADGTLYLPFGSPTPGPADRLRVRGDVYEVDGLLAGSPVPRAAR